MSDFDEGSPNFGSAPDFIFKLGPVAIFVGLFALGILGISVGRDNSERNNLRTPTPIVFVAGASVTPLPMPWICQDTQRLEGLPWRPVLINGCENNEPRSAFSVYDEINSRYTELLLDVRDGQLLAQSIIINTRQIGNSGVRLYILVERENQIQLIETDNGLTGTIRDGRGGSHTLTVIGDITIYTAQSYGQSAYDRIPYEGEHLDLILRNAATRTPVPTSTPTPPPAQRTATLTPSPELGEAEVTLTMTPMAMPTGTSTVSR